MKKVSIFGGSGLIGRYIVAELAKIGFVIRVICRNADKANELKTCGHLGQVLIVTGDIHDLAFLRNNLMQCDIVINLLSVLYEENKGDFEKINVRAVQNLVTIAKQTNVKQFIHFSALGVSRDNLSKYSQTKLAGEKIVITFPNHIIIRPSVVFAKEDKFFNRLALMVKYFPIIFLVNNGKTLMQPVYAQDIARLIVCIIQNPLLKNRIYEAGGDTVYSFKELVEFVIKTTNRKCMLLSVPFSIASYIAYILQWSIVRFLLKPFIGYDPIMTYDQVRLLRHDSIVLGENVLQKEFGITLTPLKKIVPEYLKIYRK